MRCVPWSLGPLISISSPLFLASVFEFWACQWRYPGGGNGQSIGLAKRGFNPFVYIVLLTTGEPTPLRSVHPRSGWNGMETSRSSYLFHFLFNYFTVDHLMSSLFKLTDHHSYNILPLDSKA